MKEPPVVARLCEGFREPPVCRHSSRSTEVSGDAASVLETIAFVGETNVVPLLGPVVVDPRMITGLMAAEEINRWSASEGVESSNAQPKKYDGADLSMVDKADAR